MSSRVKTTEIVKRRWNRTARHYDRMMALVERVIVGKWRRLLGSGVEIEDIKDETSNVAELLKKFAKSESSLLGCGTCMRLRHREAGLILKSTMPDLATVDCGLRQSGFL